MIPKKIIDNSDVKLSAFLNDVLKEIPNTHFDIATAFFNLQAYAYVKDNIQGVKRFRLLLGKAPEIRNDDTLGDVLLRMIREEVEGFDLSKEKDSLVKEFVAFLGKEDVEDFKAGLIKLLESSRFGSKEYTPYEVYIKSLFELQKEDIKAEEGVKETEFRPSSKVNLAEFQEDAVRRIFTRLKKYRACMVADSVGLGKTWIAKRVVEEFGFYKRRRFLIICPAQLRGMWKDAVKDLILAESILSQEELASLDFLDKAKQAVGGGLDEVSLIVIDESHNFRNPLSNRWENLFTLLVDHIAKGKGKPYILFLTATPINNTIWDLYWQGMILILMDQRG